MDESSFAVEYSSGGGMSGGRTDITLERAGTGMPTISYDITEYNGGPRKKGSKTLPKAAEKDLRDIYDRRGVKGWGRLEKSDLIALDAPSVSVTFRVDGRMTRISDDDVLPENGRGIIFEVYRCLMGYVSGDDSPRVRSSFVRRVLGLDKG